MLELLHHMNWMPVGIRGHCSFCNCFLQCQWHVKGATSTCVMVEAHAGAAPAPGKNVVSHLVCFSCARSTIQVH